MTAQTKITPARPIGADAPKHNAEWANYQAACIAAREVYPLTHRSERHRASYEAWRNGLRASPWPDPTPEETRRADDAVRGLIGAME